MLINNNISIFLTRKRIILICNDIKNTPRRMQILLNYYATLKGCSSMELKLIHTYVFYNAGTVDKIKIKIYIADFF